MKNILQDNASEAWALAKTFSLKIQDGLATFQNKKLFVSCLHNSTELFIKSQMINQNDLRVLIPRSVNSDGSPAKNYYSTTDLNSFITSELASNPSDFSKNYYSCEYNQLQDFHKELFKTYYDTHPDEKIIVCDGLHLLQELRNNETHFSVDSNAFLTEKEFVQLHNFMIVFYEILSVYYLLPFFGDPSPELKYKFEISNIPLRNFTFKKALLNSETAKKIAKDMENLPRTCGLDAFAIADEIIMFNRGVSGPAQPDGYLQNYDQFDDAVSYIQQMVDFKLVELITHNSTSDTDDEVEGFIESRYVFRCWKDI